MKKESRLILALDETDKEKALWIADSVSDTVDAVKINWPLILSAGPGIITDLSRRSDVICDFKVADIPNTVRLIVENAVDRGATAVICHAFAGSDSMREAVQVANAKGASVYAVAEMSHPGGKEFIAPNAEELAHLGVDAGARGVIAPATRPERIVAIREIVGNLEILSPGVGAQGGSALSAIKAGADYVIVGRAIYRAGNPAKAAEDIAAEIRTVT